MWMQSACDFGGLWCAQLVITVLRKLRQEDCQFQGSFGYIDPVLKTSIYDLGLRYNV